MQAQAELRIWLAGEDIQWWNRVPIFSVFTWTQTECLCTV